MATGLMVFSLFYINQLETRKVGEEKMCEREGNVKTRLVIWVAKQSTKDAEGVSVKR